MTSYTYYNGIYQVTTYIREGFKRFHSMNAQCAEFDIDSRWHCYQFISYATNICQAIYDHKYNKWHVIFNGNPFNFSPSTSRQVSRWLRENGFPFTPSVIRDAYKNCNAITPDVSSFSIRNVDIDFVSPNVINRNWR